MDKNINYTKAIQDLLAWETFGNRQPSELLRVLKTLAENYNIADSFLFEIFSQTMPEPVQPEVDDKILAIYPNLVSSTSFGGGENPSTVTDLSSGINSVSEKVNVPNCVEYVQITTNPRHFLSNSSSCPDASNSIPLPSSSSNYWLERDSERKIPRKRSNSENCYKGRDNVSNKRETPDRMKKEENSENERQSENSNDIPFRSIRGMPLASQLLAAATMSQQSQQQMAGAMPQPSQSQFIPEIHQQDLPYPSYYNVSEGYHIDPNQGACALNPFSSTIPTNSQWTANNVFPETLSCVAPALRMGIDNGMELGVPSNGSLNGHSYMNMGNSDASVNQMPPTCQMPAILNNTVFPSVIPLFNILEPITITHAVLTPPLPGEKRPRKERPPWLRTVIVSNLPKKITEEIIREAFQRCGQISVIRISIKNFCHIRFVSMESVDQALLLSGFRIRIDENEDDSYNGTLHVDYANAQDDLRDWKCLVRARAREERHRQQQDNFHVSLPPAVPRFSDHEAQTLAERLRNEETFKDGLQVLITWLDRGVCNKRNSATFYSLIQSSHSHVKRLRKEKSRFEEEAKKAKENLMNKNRAIGSELIKIEKVFVSAKIKKVWDHFTKSQRNKIEEMKNDTNDFKLANSGDLINNRVEEGMDMSDSEDINDARVNGDVLQLTSSEDLNMLREKVDSLTEQLDAAHKTVKEFKVQYDEHKKEIVKLRLDLEESKKLEKSGND